MRRMGLALVVVLATAGTANANTTLDRRIVPGPTGPTGFTPLVAGPGEGFTVRGDLAAPQAGRADRRRSLGYFAQLSDFQLADEESPARVEVLDQANALFSSAFRPQEALLPHVIDASIRQVNANRRSPLRAGDGRRAKLGWTILTGDNADNQQANEVRWVSELLDGAMVDPNSGRADPEALTGAGCALADADRLAAEAPLYTGVQDADDAPLAGTFYDPDAPAGTYGAFPAYPGLMDRAQQPFQATGLRVPSYVAIGNHDLLVQGNQASNPSLDAVARGCIKPLVPTLNPDVGALLMQTMLNPAGSFLVPPDPARGQVNAAQYRATLAEHGLGRVDPAELEASRGAAGYYTFAPRKGLRFIALDTVANGGVTGPSAEGNVDDPQFRWLGAQLDAAEAAGELVVVYSHHAPVSLTANVSDEVAGACSDTETPGCDLDPRPSTPLHLGDDLTTLLLDHPHVVAWVAGHSHVNDVAFAKRDGRGFWIVRTSAEADYPHQDRLLELHDNRDGTLSLFGTLLDNAAPARIPPPGTPAAGMMSAQLAAIARTLGFNDPDASATAVGDPDDRNVELLLPDPRAGAQPLRATVRPRRIVAKRRTTLKVRVRPAGRVAVRFGGKRRITSSRGRVNLRVRVKRAGVRRVRVGGRPVRIRVVRRR